MIPIVGLSGNHSKRYIQTKKHRLRHVVLARWIISWTSNSIRSLYHFRVYGSPTCNATAGIDEFWKKHFSGAGGKENKNAICGVYVMPVVHCCLVHCIPRAYVIPIVGFAGTQCFLNTKT